MPVAYTLDVQTTSPVMPRIGESVQMGNRTIKIKDIIYNLAKPTSIMIHLEEDWSVNEWAKDEYRQNCFEQIIKEYESYGWKELQ